MRVLTRLWLLAPLAACSVPDKFLIDGGPAGDSTPSADADPQFACLGQPLPTTAPATLTVRGETRGLGEGALPVVALNAYVVGGANPFIVTQSDANAAFSFDVSTSGAPVDAYVVATYSAHLATHYYPAAPLAASYTDTLVLMTPTKLAQLASAAGTNFNTGMAQLYITVVDCTGAPIPHATVTTAPPGLVAPFRNSLPSATATDTDASGLVAVFNVPPTQTITATATTPGGTFRSTRIVGGGASLIQTKIQP